MRARYNMSDSGRSGRGRTTHYDDWDAYDDVTWDDGRGSGRGRSWREPSVDSIGGRNLKPRRNNSILDFIGGNLPIIIGVLVILILLVAIIAVAMNSCSSQDATQDEQAVQQEQTQEGSEASDGSSTSSSSSGSSSSSTPTAAEQINRAALERVLEPETVDKLIYRASTSEDALWIAQHPEAYAGDGEAVQRKILKLAADEPAALTFVRNYPEKYPMKLPQNGSINTVATGRNIPRLYQWDALWGYTVYSGTSFGLTGCCPTALAMVYQGITGSTEFSPFDMAELAERDGYMTEEEGTVASFLTEEASSLGLTVRSIDVSKKALKDAIESGEVVIANFAPGYFTEGGHYVVISGTNQEGQLVMNDPYSEERSNQTWDYDLIVNESVGLYAYS